MTVREPYYVIDDAVTPEEVVDYLDLIKRSALSQGVEERPEVTTAFWSRHGERLAAMGFTGVLTTVTISKNNRPVPRHTDQRIGDGIYKVLIYLNEVPGGGTIFYVPGSGERLVENRVGRMVMFDIRLEHKSQVFRAPQWKYTIGFRLRGPARN